MGPKDNQDPQGEEEKQQEPVDDVEEVVKETGEDSAETAEKEDDDDENSVDNNKIHMKVAADAPWKDRMWEVFTTFWPLGLVSVLRRLAFSRILTLYQIIISTRSFLSFSHTDRIWRPSSSYFHFARPFG